MLTATRVNSPNFSPEIIPVEFIVLHYTAVNLKETLAYFVYYERKVCAHFVIDSNGSLYELGDFLQGPILKGAHAGQSCFVLDDAIWENFNQFAIGIELVNPNGNFFPYSDAQYQTLIALCRQLKLRFPSLKNPERIVGHEHIAGMRGKVDPGRLFNWELFYQGVYPDKEAPVRHALLNPRLLADFRFEGQKIAPEDKANPRDWGQISSALELFVAQNQEKATS